MRCICIDSAGSEAEQGHKVKFEVLTPLNFLTLPSFSVTSPSCKPEHCLVNGDVSDMFRGIITDLRRGAKHGAVPLVNLKLGPERFTDIQLVYKEIRPQESIRSSSKECR